MAARHLLDRLVAGLPDLGTSMPTEINFQLPRGPEAVEQARRALDDLRPEVGGRELDDLRLLVSELVTNSVRYGQGRPVWLHALVSDGHARVQVDDAGPGFVGPSERPCGGQRSGWGLVLVAALAERWGIDRGARTSVWFELPLGPSRPEPRTVRSSTLSLAATV